MTITYADKIALIPTRCDCCNRLFIFEPYWKINRHWIDNPTGPGFLAFDVECKNCHEKRIAPKLKTLKLTKVPPKESEKFFEGSRDMTDEELRSLVFGGENHHE